MCTFLLVLADGPCPDTASGHVSFTFKELRDSHFTEVKYKTLCMSEAIAQKVFKGNYEVRTYGPDFRLMTPLAIVCSLILFVIFVVIVVLCWRYHKRKQESRQQTYVAVGSTDKSQS